ncbi:MAG: hypothetical protein H9Q66_01085 [Spiroplasma ixodetis]|nr:hypothetical protein [Spiroplasma ixodetis]
MRKAKKALKRINKANQKLTDFDILKRSLDFCIKDALKQFNQSKIVKNPTEEQNDYFRQTTETISFKVKQYINIKGIVESFKKDNYLDENDFDEKNKAFIKFKKYLNLIENNPSIFNFTITAISQTKNKFNEEYFDEEKKIVKWECFNELYDNEKEQKLFLKKHLNEKFNFPQLLFELLLRGDQTLKISYNNYEINITNKGFEYLNDGWWNRNWKWLGTSLIAIILPILIKIFWR